MIDIIRFRELMVELQVKVNQKSEDKIDCCFLAVKEEHMVKKLKDKTGVLLCANYPDAEGDSRNKDNWQEDNQVIFFICEKLLPVVRLTRKNCSIMPSCSELCVY